MFLFRSIQCAVAEEWFSQECLWKLFCKDLIRPGKYWTLNLNVVENSVNLLVCRCFVNIWLILCYDVCALHKWEILTSCVSNKVKEFEWSQEHVPAGRPGKNIFYPFTQILPWLAWTALCQALWYNTILWRVIRIFWSAKISAVLCGTLMCKYMCSCTLESLAAMHHIECVSMGGVKPTCGMQLVNVHGAPKK